MARLKETDLKANLIINGDKYKSELGKLEVATRDLKSENKDLRLEKKKLLAADKKGTEEYRRVTEAIKKNNVEIKENEVKMSKLRKTIGLTGLTTRQLRQEQKRLKSIMSSMTPGTKQWKKYNKELGKVNARIKKVTVGGSSLKKTFGKMANSLNKYALLGASVVAAFTGIAMGAQQLIEGNANLSDSFADVQKTTGLTNSEVKDLYGTMKKFDTRSANKELLGLARIAGKLGVKGKKDIEGFVKSADQINVALSEDLGGDVETTIREVGKLVDIFKVKQEFGLEQGLLKVGSAINTLGATSTANEQYLVDFSKRMGGLAPNAGISASDILGLGATLDQLGQRAELSSTVLSKITVAMGSDIPKFAGIAGMAIDDFSTLMEEDANEALIKVLEGAKSNKKGLAGMAESLEKLGVSGQRTVQVVGTLSGNVEMLREQQDIANKSFKEGTSLTEEFNIKNETMAAKLDKIGKRIRGAFINSGVVEFLGSAVDKVEEWTRTKLSDELRKEQTELMVLKNRITDTNIKSEDRLKLIKNLKESYPDYLGYIDEEKISNDELTKAVNRVNDQYIKRIQIQLQQEKIEETATDAAEAANEKAERRVALEQKFAELNRDYKLGLDLANKSFEERFKLIRTGLAAQGSSNSAATAQAINLSRLVDKYVESIYDAKIAQEEYNQEAQVSNEIIEESKKGLDDISKKLNNRGSTNTELTSTETTNTETTNTTNTSVNVSTSGTSEAAKKREELNARLSDLFKEYEKSKLESHERELQDIRDKYNKEIELAGENKEVIKELELLKDKELADAKREYALQQEEEQIERQRQFEQRKLELRKELNLLSDEEMKEIELQQLKQAYNEKLLTVQEYEREKARVEAQYRKIRAQETKKLEDEILDKRKKTFADSKAIASTLTSTVVTLKEYEVQKAGDNEAKKLEIMKKYADIEFAAKAAEIIASTAVAIMQGYAQLGPVGGTIAAILLGITGVAQLAIAEDQRSKVKQLKKGKLDVIGIDDNRHYTAPMVDRLEDGIVDSPTLVGEEPEIVINPATTRNIMRFNPEVMDSIKGNYVKQYASGKGVEGEDTTPDNAILIAKIDLLTRAINNIPKVFRAYFTEEEVYKIREEISNQEDIEDSAA